ncbi:response regulator [Glycomyces harbinensis]|uniref:Response regulator receiver domain-containing protein n=1 Tax=Glycomyces harbinensis TaxID=58114 RepID=A0A1G7A3D2_9ACTN|nr:response regulator [Glycomyces harbinensis]SDE08555.1 Response regulator receiver domain-containing protein [Glycomyces harbinensis]
MSEAVWIELIKVLPAFLWIGFGFIALAVAKRIFTQQAPRMSKIETPWVTVELAQQAIEQAAVRGPAQQQIAVPEPDWSSLFNVPAQPVPAEPPYAGPVPAGPASPPYTETADAAEEDEEPFPTEPPADPAAKPLATPPADGPADNANAGKKHDDNPPVPMTEPQPTQQVPPVYPVSGAASGGSYYGQPVPGSRSRYAAAAPLPPYAMPSAYQRQPPSADQRGLRAATRLALSADLLQGGAILWADDHPEWNEPLIRLFRTAGITVDAVVSTARAMLALKDRSYDLVITDLRRINEANGSSAGIHLLDQMIAVGVPTPAVLYSSHPNAELHPRVVITTNSPEKLVDTVVDIVGTRRSQQAHTGQTWLDRLKGN